MHKGVVLFVIQAAGQFQPFGGSFWKVTVRVSMAVSVVVRARLVVCLLVILCIGGCSRPSGPQRVAVQGLIDLDGEPLKAGRISFEPVEGTSGPSAVATVTDGAYQLNERIGPIVGKNKVRIESLPDPGFAIDDEAAYAQADEQKKGRPVLPREVIPPEYNSNSTQVVDVSTAQKLTFDFHIKSTSKKRP